jgi:hypothetical protein
MLIYNNNCKCYTHVTFMQSEYNFEVYYETVIRQADSYLVYFSMSYLCSNVADFLTKQAINYHLSQKMNLQHE